MERGFGFRGGYFSVCVRSEEELQPPFLKFVQLIKNELTGDFDPDPDALEIEVVSDWAKVRDIGDT